MAGTFKIEKWGPVPLREIHKEVEKAINDRTPLAGMGIKIEELPTGMRIHVDTNPNTPGSNKSGAGGAGGTSVNVYGAFNGAPALFHLLQSSPPTPV